MRDEVREAIVEECYKCNFMAEVIGDCHIKCLNPDPNMKGNLHGIKNGWFYYPLLFDPVWKKKLCANFQQKEK